MATSFGQALRALRLKARVTQRELAQRIGVDFSYISKLENNRLPPPAADTVVAICRALNAPAEQLLALVGKLPSEVERAVATKPAGQRFLREALLLKLSNEDWRELQTALHRLKEEQR